MLVTKTNPQSEDRCHQTLLEDAPVTETDAQSKDRHHKTLLDGMFLHRRRNETINTRFWAKRSHLRDQVDRAHRDSETRPTLSAGTLNRIYGEPLLDGGDLCLTTRRWHDDGSTTGSITTDRRAAARRHHEVRRKDRHLRPDERPRRDAAQVASSTPPDYDHRWRRIYEDAGEWVSPSPRSRALRRRSCNNIISPPSS